MNQKTPTTQRTQTTPTRLFLSALALTLLATGLGCHAMRAALVPVPVLAPQAPHSQRLVILLPGRGGDAEDFRRGGFFDAAAKAGFQGDIVAADLHEGYYQNRTMIDRLRQDVILPARARGYNEVWLVGVSLGGFGALLYAEEHPDEVQGVVVLAPFLGDEAVLKQVAAAGGAKGWKPAGPIATADYTSPLWLWIQNRETQSNPCPVLLGYGTGDRFASSCALFSATLPGDHVFTQSGGHEWHTWRGLWERVLVSPAFREG